MDEDTKAYWSPGNQVFFCDGWAYGLNHRGRTVCIGKEVDIQRALRDNASTGESFIDNILTEDRNNRQSEILPSRMPLRRRRIKIQAFGRKR